MKGDFILPPPLHGLIGHRGVAGHAPENTFASIQLAKQMGLNWIEIDVRRAKNSELVIFHDPTLERTTDGKGRLLQHDVNHLKNLDAGIWFSPNFQNERVPTLPEALLFIAKLEMSVNLEIKCPANTPKDQILSFASNLDKTIKLYWSKHLAYPLVSSYNLNFIKAYRNIAPYAPIGILTDQINKEIIQLVQTTQNCTLHCGHRHLTPELVKDISSQGIKLLVYTINDKKLGLLFLKSGAFALFSDTPDIFIKDIHSFQ